MKLNSEQLAAIRQLCPIYYVKDLCAFGSVVREDFNEQSDVDLLVSFSGVPLLDFADNYFEFQEALQQILGRKVDLVIEKSLTNPVLIHSIHKTKQTIYGVA